MKTMILAVGAIGLFSCAEHSYVYTPESANALASGLPAEKISIPQERPQGSVEITSYGITRLHEQGTRIPALHVRMIVSNDGDAQPWQLDTRQQLAQIDGEGQSRAMYVNGNVRSLPIVTIARGQRIALDMYFPLPATVRHEGQLPHFDVLWQVATPERVVASRTTFDRVYQQPDTYVSDAGLWPYWWYDPFYPDFVFVHANHMRVSRR